MVTTQLTVAQARAVVAPPARPSPRSSPPGSVARLAREASSHTLGGRELLTCCTGWQPPPRPAQHARRARCGRAVAARRARGVESSGQYGASLPLCAPRRLGEACSGRSTEYSGRLRRAPGGQERENRIPEPATEPPSAGFGPCGARGVLGATAIVAQDSHRFYPPLTPPNTLLGRVMCRSTILVRALPPPPGWSCAPKGEARSDQIEAMRSRRGPRQPRCPVVFGQSYRDHPAAAWVHR